MQKNPLIIGGATFGIVAALLGGSAIVSAAEGAAAERVVWQHTEADTAPDTRIQKIPAGTRLAPLCYSISPAYPVNGNPAWFVVKVRGHVGYVSGSDAHLAVGDTRRC